MFVDASIAAQAERSSLSPPFSSPTISADGGAGEPLSVSAPNPPVGSSGGPQSVSQCEKSGFAMMFPANAPGANAASATTRPTRADRIMSSLLREARGWMSVPWRKFHSCKK
jgi:hypothetical protein